MFFHANWHFRGTHCLNITHQAVSHQSCLLLISFIALLESKHSWVPRTTGKNKLAVHTKCHRWKMGSQIQEKGHGDSTWWHNCDLNIQLDFYFFFKGFVFHSLFRGKISQLWKEFKNSKGESLRNLVIKADRKCWKRLSLGMLCKIFPAHTW